MLRSGADEEARTCVVTGASGYVGSRVAAAIERAGWTVRTLGRSGADRVFDLSSPVDREALAGADALVHLSYDFSARGWEEIRRVNVEGSRRLFTAARDAGVATIVCVSSVAAFPGTRSQYGRAKLEIEAAAHAAGGCAIRPGLVWGQSSGAMFGALEAVVSRLPVVPLPAPPGLPMLMANEDDLGRLVTQVLERGGLSGELIVAGADELVTFAALLRTLAAAHGRHPRLLALPWRLAWLGLRTLELAGIDPPFRSDSLLSLVNHDPRPLVRATIPAASLDVTFRPYPVT